MPIYPNKTWLKEGQHVSYTDRRGNTRTGIVRYENYLGVEIQREGTKGPFGLDYVQRKHVEPKENP